MKKNLDYHLIRCINHLIEGNILLYPTDTIWGLGCDATNAIAVEKESREAPAPKQQKVSVPKSSPSTFEKVLNNKTTKSLATTATREITRGLLGILVKAFKK